MLQRKDLSIKSECYNERGRILLTDATQDRSARDLSRIPALIRASVINFYRLKGSFISLAQLSDYLYSEEKVH